MLVHIREFLEENPSEFLMVSFQLEIGLSDPHKYILQEMKEAGVDAIFSKKIPTVGEIRGKAFIIAGVYV